MISKQRIDDKYLSLQSYFCLTTSPFLLRCYDVSQRFRLHGFVKVFQGFKEVAS